MFLLSEFKLEWWNIAQSLCVYYFVLQPCWLVEPGAPVVEITAAKAMAEEEKEKEAILLEFVQGTSFTRVDQPVRRNAEPSVNRV